MEQWERVRDGLADLWDWWGEGVHMRPQPSTNRRSKETEWNCVAWDVTLTCRDLSNKDVKSIVPVRMTTIDGHLGDGLFQLCMDVHREIILGCCGVDFVSQIKVDTQRLITDIHIRRLGEDKRLERRYQSRVSFGGRSAIVFWPNGSEGVFLRTYSQRIEAAGFREARRGLFPHGVRLELADLRTPAGYLMFFGEGNMRMTNLRDGNYRFSFLNGTDLGESNLCQTDLTGANLCGAVLSGANLCRADLTGANLSDADLRGADLTEADLSRADLRDADLRGANIRGADLRKANLTEARVTRQQIDSATIDQSTRGLDSIRED